MKRPERRPWITSLILEILGVKRQLREVQAAQQRMEVKMVQEFENLKAEIARAVTVITAAIAKMSQPNVDPAEFTAQAEALKGAVDSLEAAVNG